ncbi:MAG: Dam family site-specific DNA-(adenine-N6)-methyltransferase [Gammaproteobacteria bacterium]|nr:Dam family site-specific DNA-(adenine-N6)-methyltransferase [Gammaproteobacteria bacterium]
MNKPASQQQRTRNTTSARTATKANVSNKARTSTSTNANASTKARTSTKASSTSTKASTKARTSTKASTRTRTGIKANTNAGTKVKAKVSTKASIKARINAGISTKASTGTAEELSAHQGAPSVDRGALARPFLKWAGGKRRVVAHIEQNLPTSFLNYYEPFAGGGAAFFALRARIGKGGKAYLSDINKDLIDTWKAIKRAPTQIIGLLEQHKIHHSQEYYLKLRKEGHDDSDAFKRAARFIYLNRTCYNGLYRVNRAGRFNVPMGRYVNPPICDADNLHEVARVLKDVSLRTHSFAAIKPSAGDLVYCDPPYNETFTNYTPFGFDDDAQRALRQACDNWRAQGVNVIVSSSDTKLIRKEYKNYKKVKINASQLINCRADQRGKRAELLLIGLGQ